VPRVKEERNMVSRMEKVGEFNKSKKFSCLKHGSDFRWKERCFGCKKLVTEIKVI
jgi:hypothetical protein